MDIFNLLALGLTIFILAITPGPGVFLVISKAITLGFQKTIPVVLGIIIGDLIFLSIAIYSLISIIETLNIVFVIIQYLAAIYLIWLGIQLWQLKPNTIIIKPIEPMPSYNFLAGLLITLSNPKAAFFYLGLLPAFIDLADISAVYMMGIAFMITTILGSVMLLYAFAASAIQAFFQSQAYQEKLDKIAGTMMIITGLVLILKNI